MVGIRRLSVLVLQEILHVPVLMYGNVMEGEIKGINGKFSVFLLFLMIYFSFTIGHFLA